MAQAWDGCTLKLSFRRCVDKEFLIKWQQLLTILAPYTPNCVIDQPVWVLEPTGVYSVRSFYNMINWGGVYTPVWKKFWKIVVRRRYLVFLWLALHNKILTRDNLSKRRLYCDEQESVQHLLFDCLIAKDL